MDEGGCDEDAGAEVSGDEEEIMGYGKTGEPAGYDWERTSYWHMSLEAESGDDNERPTCYAQAEDENQGEEVQGGVVGFGALARATGGFRRSVIPPCYLGLK